MKLIRYKYPNTTCSNPLSRLFDFETPTMERFEKLFDDFLGAEAYVDQLPVNLYEDDKNFYMQIELPDIDKNAINLELEKGVLTLSYSNSEKTEDGKADCGFRRSISVPDEATQDQITANLNEGILTVTLPKKEATKPLQIKVK